MGDSPGGSGFSVEVHGLRAPDYDRKEACGKKYKRNSKKSLKSCENRGIIDARDNLLFLAHSMKGWARDQKEEIRMNKYELALVVSAKIEDDARTATVEKAKDYIVRAGGTVTEVEDWGKKKLAYDIQKMSEGYFYFIQFDAEATAPAAIEQDVRIMDNVLRFLCVRKDEA